MYTAFNVESDYQAYTFPLIITDVYRESFVGYSNGTTMNVDLVKVWLVYLCYPLSRLHGFSMKLRQEWTLSFHIGIKRFCIV